MTKEECEVETSKAIMEMRKRITELEMTVGTLRTFSNKQATNIENLQKENAELSEKLNRYKHDCTNCSAFGLHCPHKVNGDPYFYDCYLTVVDLEKENAELRVRNRELLESCEGATMMYKDLCETKKLLKNIISVTWGEGWNYSLGVKVRAEQFLKEIENV